MKKIIEVMKIIPQSKLFGKKSSHNALFSKFTTNLRFKCFITKISVNIILKYRMNVHCTLCRQACFFSKQWR